MFGHYLMSALRNLRRHRLAALVGIVGLAAGLYCLLAALVVVRHLASADSQFPASERIHVVYQSLELPDGPEVATWPLTVPPVAARIETEFPELEGVARSDIDVTRTISIDGEESLHGVMAADPTFFDIFELEFAAGPAGDVLAPGTALVTTSGAQAMFGTIDVVGRSLRVDGEHDVVVGGVIEMPRGLSHLKDSLLGDGPVDLVMRWDTVHDSIEYAPGDDAWTRFSGVTYVRLPADGSLTARDMNARLAGFGERHMPPASGTAAFEIRHVSNLIVDFMYSIYVGDRLGGVSVQGVLVLLGVVTLLVSGVNFVNLLTAAASRRAREHGMRKVLGARPRQLVALVFAESIVTVIAALALALLAIELTASFVARRSESPVPDLVWSDPGTFAVLAGLSVLVAALTAAYPAWLVTRARPGDVLKLGAGTAGPGRLRGALTGGQFAAASLLLIAIAVMQAQNSVLRERGGAPSREPLVVLDAPLGAAGVDPDVFARALERHRAVLGVTGSSFYPYTFNLAGDELHRAPEAGGASAMFQSRLVRHDYFDVIGTRIVAGRGFSEARGDERVAWPGAAEPDRPVRVVVNAAGAAELGFASPADAIGQLVYAGDAAREIVGVVEGETLTLVALSNAFVYYPAEPASAGVMLVRLRPDDAAAGLTHVESTWQRLAPDHVLTYDFVDDLFNEVYRPFASLNLTFTVLGSIAVLIALSGLFAIASFVTRGRLREVGIRKVQGAKSFEIVRQLSLGLILPAVLANLAMWPLAFVGARAYLGLFVHRAELTVWPFLASLAACLVIALLAVGRHAWVAARTPTAAVLRYE